MTPSKPRADRIRLMRATHAACRAAGIDETVRHDLQLRITGKASMRDMGAGDLGRLLDEVNRLSGFDTRGGNNRSGPRRHPLAPRADLRLIHALWGELGRKGALRQPGRAGLNAFIRRRFAGHWSYVPIDVDALTDPACITDVIRALRAMLARTDPVGGATA